MSGERPPYPTELDGERARREVHELEQHVAIPGRVERYDAATQAADVLPLVRHPVPQPDGSYALEDLPVVPSVPVIFPRVGRMFVSLPVSVGDTVQLLVNTAAIRHWRAGSGDVTDPGDLRRQHLAHAVAIPGLYARSAALGHASATDLVLGDDQGTRVAIKPDGTVTITTGAGVALKIDADGTVHLGGAAGEAVAMAALVKGNLDALKTIFDAWSPVPNDGGAALKTALAGWTVAEVAATKTRAV